MIRPTCLQGQELADRKHCRFHTVETKLILIIVDKRQVQDYNNKFVSKIYEKQVKILPRQL